MKKLLSIIIINLLLSANPLISLEFLTLKDALNPNLENELDEADRAAQEKVDTTTQNTIAKNKAFRENQTSATEQTYINKDVTQEEANYMQTLLNQLSKAKSNYETSRSLAHDISLLGVNPKSWEAVMLRKKFIEKFHDTPEVYPQRALEQYSLLQTLYDEKKVAISNRPAKVATANRPVRPARPPRLGRLAPAGAPFANRPVMPARLVPSTPISNRPPKPTPLLERRPFAVPTTNESRILD